MRGGTQKMPSLAKAYIAMIAAVAVAVLTVAAYRWNSENFTRFLLFFGLAMVASAMKIRLPGFKTTISINFVFILTGIALFSFGETVLIGLAGRSCNPFGRRRRGRRLCKCFLTRHV